MTSGQRQQRVPTRSGVRRRGDEYQDSVALEIMVDWLEHPDRYQWMQVEADDRGALDDVVALDTRNVLHVWQVKHAAHPDIPEDAYTWDFLLAQSEGRRGGTTQSLLQKWAKSLERLWREYTEVDACVTSNRSAAPDLQAALSSHGLVDFDAIADEQTRRAIALQLGSEAQARAFFTQFHFRLNRPNRDELLEGARVRFQQLGGTDDGWSNLKEEVADWVNFKDIPTPGGISRCRTSKTRPTGTNWSPYDKSHGHPLHLRYTFAAMQEQRLDMTPETVRSLPGCAHADITAYYGELWRAVPEESRRILCLLAACPFSWPREGILDCLDPQGDRRSDLISALRQVQHLLRRDSLGLRPFHSSLLQFLLVQPSYRDYATSVSRKALAWLQTAGPEHLRWAYEWLLVAQLGDEQPLLDGPTRHWAVEASARRRPYEETKAILGRCLSLALRSRDLPRAAAVGLLKDYYKNAVESYEVLQEQLLTPQVMTDPEGFLSRYLSAHLARLSDEEVATLAEIFWQEGNESGVRRCAQLVTQRARSQRQRIAQERRLRRNAHLAPLVKVRALLPNCATESLVDLSLLRRDNGYAEIMLGILGASVLRRKDVPRMRDLLKPAALSRLLGAERAIVSRAAVLLALEEGIPLPEDLSQPGYDDDPFVALYRVLRGHGGTSGRAIRFPDARLLQMQSTEVYEKQGEVQTCMYQAFFCFLANELLGAGERNSAWLQDVEAQGWHVLFLRRLATIAKELAPDLLEGRPFGLGRFYELLAVLPYTPGRPFETEWNYSNAALEIIPALGLDLYLIANAGGNIPPILPEEMLPLLESEYGELEAWLRIYASRGRPWLHDDTLTMLIQEQRDSNDSERRSFEEHARGYAALASVTALHRRSDQTQDALMKAGEYMIAHAYHKDLLFFSVLESIQAYHQHVCTVPSGDSAGCVCAHWVRSLVPAVSRIRDYTDGDETRYAPEKLAEVLSEISPDALLNCYQWQRRYGDRKDALITLHAFLNVADLDDPAHRALAAEATDPLSRSILQRRSKDANLLSRTEHGETDGPSEFQQESPPSRPGQEDQPAFNAERPKGLPRPASYPHHALKTTCRHCAASSFPMTRRR